MQTDAYTKSILTIIALCLVLHVLNSFSLVPSVKASAFDQSGYVLAPVNEDGSMNVRLVGGADNTPMDVNIVGCYDCPLDVKVKGQVEVTGSIQCYE